LNWFCSLTAKKKNQYIHDLEEVGKLSALNVTFPLLTRLASYIHIPIFDKSQQNLQHFDHHVMQSLQRHRTLVENDDRNVKSTLFSKMYKAEDENGLTPTEMAHNALAYIVAGSDTTANTLAYLVWAVCKNPEVKKRLAEEVKTLPDTFSDDDIRELPYLDQVIKETLRLYPSVPSPLPRVVPAGGEMLGDQWLPGGTTVSSQAFTLHRNPEIFSYPEMFNPSRWEEPTQAMKDSILTFGGGSRICIGIHLAQLELRLATARFFRTFPNATVSSLEGMSDADMEQNMFFLMSPKGQRCLIQAF
jgi:cytochrome P450